VENNNSGQEGKRTSGQADKQTDFQYYHSQNLPETPKLSNFADSENPKK